MKPSFAIPMLLALLTALDAPPGSASVRPAPASAELCPRPAPGALVREPAELRSVNGVLEAELGIYNYRSADGTARYCYRTADGIEAPTLRVQPGDLVVLRLINHLAALDAPADAVSAAAAHHHHEAGAARADEDPCTGGAMTATSTNLHFHGMTLPAVCHQDDVLRTSIQPGDVPFEYRFTVPPNEPPGLYWYHPHIHGFSSRQVTGGASGAMIIEGIERAIPEVAGLPERVFVIRDLDLMHPDAQPSSAEPVVPRAILDPDGDVANNNTGFGKPARDLSVNFVPAPYPDYTPARILMRPGERQLWRVLNASAITYVHLTLLFDKRPQDLGIVALDGSPINQGDAAAPRIKTVDHITVPPGSRVEFIMQGPPVGTKAVLISRVIDTGPDGENDPNRTLAAIEASPTAPKPRLEAAGAQRAAAAARAALGGLDNTGPHAQTVFSEARSDPADPRSPTVFFLTVDGETPRVFDPANASPNIVARQGDVEDWIIENRSYELHAFHIHQIHFQLREWFGIEVDEPFLRDTVNVPFYEVHNPGFPSVRVRMDFRDPNTVGTFVYHCHLLEHEDGGMMGTIRVDPAAP